MQVDHLYGAPNCREKDLRIFKFRICFLNK
jgi:hypothetical protein